MKWGNSRQELISRFEETLHSILEKFSNNSCSSNGIAIAYSGGLDSSALLFLAIEFCKKRSIPLFAFHINHGLSPNASEWMAHCNAYCVARNVPFFSETVQVSFEDGNGIEASARTVRYQALGQLCRANQAGFLLTAHHQNDQVETLLLQLLRGTGIAGRAGMEICRSGGALLGSSSIYLARPLLNESKATLEEFVVKNSIPFVEDESNFDQRYIRNALRHDVIPVLESISPGFAERMVRGCDHIRSTGSLLNEIADQDMYACQLDGGLNVDLIGRLSSERIDNLLRRWIEIAGGRMPSTSRLKEIRSQLLNAREDAQVTLFHEKFSIHRYQKNIFISNRQLEDVCGSIEQEFIWAGETYLDFPQFNGRLHFEASDSGICAQWLRQTRLTLHFRKGGERLRLSSNRPSRSLKSHYQALNIPFWIRKISPLISHAGNLVFAAGIGIQCTYFAPEGHSSINLKWVANT